MVPHFDKLVEQLCELVFVPESMHRLMEFGICLN